MFKHMGYTGNASYKTIQHKLDTLENIMINEGIAIVRLAEVKINRSKIHIKDNIYRMGGWFKTRSIRKVYKWVTTSYGAFQSGGTSIMAVDEVSCRAIVIVQ